jgi:hypothetical protein
MRISTEQIKKLQDLLSEQFDLVYTDEEAQRAGLAIMRFVLAKEFRTSNESKEKNDEK